MECADIAKELRSCGKNDLGIDRIDPGITYGCPSDCIGGHRFGFISGTVLVPGETRTIIAKPQQRCQPARLWVSEVEAMNFLLMAGLVGSENLLATTTPVPLYEWLEYTNTVAFRRLICDISEEVALTIKNIGGADAFFNATMTAYLLPKAA